MEEYEGVFLWSREEIEAEASTWSEDDKAKGIDFAAYPFWLTDDSGMTPRGFQSREEALEGLKEAML
jgi:hypothetical protein